MPTDLTCLTLRRSVSVYGSGGDRVKDLTPKIGPHSDGIATRGQSTCPADARPNVRPTGDVGGFRRRLEHLIASPDPGGDFTTPLAMWTETVTAAGTRLIARPAEAFAEPPRIPRASRR